MLTTPCLYKGSGGSCVFYPVPPRKLATRCEWMCGIVCTLTKHWKGFQTNLQLVKSALVPTLVKTHKHQTYVQMSHTHHKHANTRHTHIASPPELNPLLNKPCSLKKKNARRRSNRKQPNPRWGATYVSLSDVTTIIQWKLVIHIPCKAVCEPWYACQTDVGDFKAPSGSVTNWFGSVLIPKPIPILTSCAQ